MRIAICDNNPIVLEDISEMIADYSNVRKINIEYDTFLSYEEIESPDKYGLFILDYNMSDFGIKNSVPEEKRMNGMEYARFLNEKFHGKKGIIFLTAFPDFVYDAFEVRTYRFLVKPLEEDTFFKVLDDFLQDSNEIEKIIFKIKNNSIVINTNDIYYLEASNKDTLVFISDGTFIKLHKPISALANELKSFIKIHRSYIVNPTKIQSFNTRSVTLSNGTKIYMSKSNYPTVCEYFIRKKN